MPQPRKAPRFGGDPAHHKMILANLSTELFRHGRIKTTAAKAKTVQPLADKMITFAKRGDVHSRRQVLRVVRDRDVVHKLFTDIGPAFAERDGGYTRVVRLGPRKGDAAPMALIELVEGVAPRPGEGDLSEAPRRRWSLRRRRRGTLSAGAQQREEELAAAADRGEDLTADEPVGDDEPAPDDVYSDVEVNPADVEARLAADTEPEPEPDDDVEAQASATGPTPAAEQDAPAPERPADEDPSETSSDDPIEGPLSAEEQDSPDPERHGNE